MPVDRTTGRDTGILIELDIADRLLEIYLDVERRLAADIARRLAAGMEAPDWAQQKLAAIGELRRAAQRLLAQAARDTDGLIAQALVLAYMRGGEAANRELAKYGLEPLTSAAAEALDEVLHARRLEAMATLARVTKAFPGLGALQRMVRSLALRIRGTYLPVLRWAEDVYRKVIAETALPSVLLGVATRRRAAQVAWEKLLGEGVTGFVDKSGRRWELASYVEMAVRAGTAQAAVEGHMDRLQDAKINLVIVSNAPQECEKCRPWEGKILSRTGSPGPRTVTVPSAISDDLVTVHIAGTVAEAVAPPGLLHPNCFPGEVLVSAPSGVVAADARRYEGPLVVIYTARGDQLPVTPNHPVLTPEGWVAAGSLQIGQSVLRYCGDVEGATLGTPDDQQVPARIGDVFDALREASPVSPIRVPVAAEQFHGDGLGSDVDVVLADGELWHRTGDEARESELLGSGMGLGALFADGTAFEIANVTDHAANSLMGSSDLGLSLRCLHGAPLADLGLATRNVGSTLHDPATDAGLADAERGRQLVLALSGLVQADEVIDLAWREADCHVYNLETRDGWYVANSLVVSNCRHSISAFLPGATRIPTNTADPEGDKARQRLRHLERKVRREKLHAAAAIEELARKAHERKARDWQALIREHVAANAHLGIMRQPARERIGTAR